MKANSFADLGIAFDNPAKTRQAIVDNFDGWAPEITNLVQSCDDTFRKWPCYGLPVGLTWASQPAITLLGDAAHLMPPFGGGGGNVAMEDAAQLALALVNNSQTGDAIAAYEKNMFERAERAAQESADGLEMMVSPNGSHQFAQFMESVHQQPMPGRS